MIRRIWPLSICYSSQCPTAVWCLPPISCLSSGFGAVRECLLVRLEYVNTGTSPFQVDTWIHFIRYNCVSWLFRGSILQCPIHSRPDTIHIIPSILLFVLYIILIIVVVLLPRREITLFFSFSLPIMSECHYFLFIFFEHQCHVMSPTRGRSRGGQEYLKRYN